MLFRSRGLPITTPRRTLERSAGTRQDDGSGAGGQSPPIGEMGVWAAQTGCSSLATKAARFCSRREEPIGSWPFTGAPWRVDIEHG